MTREEYLQLLATSPSFQKLDPAKQEELRNAQGQLREENIKYYQEEAAMTLKAYQKFTTKVEQVVIDLKHDSAKKKKAKIEKVEVSQRGAELTGAENLLKNL